MFYGKKMQSGLSRKMATWPWGTTAQIMRLNELTRSLKGCISELNEKCAQSWGTNLNRKNRDLVLINGVGSGPVDFNGAYLPTGEVVMR